MQTTFETEFEQCKKKHMFNVLLFKMTEYYETIEMGKVNLPCFVRNDSPEKKAEKEVQWLIENDKKRFVELYELAYKDLAERGILR